MRPIIDKFVAALLNEERETASELLRQYIIAKAQDIHESLRQNDHPVLSEDVQGDIKAEHYFTDDDLSDDDSAQADDSAADSLSDEMGADDADMDADDAALDADDAAEDADMAADDAAEDEGSVDDRIDDLEAQLDELTAEFERMMSEIDGDDDSADQADDVLGSDDEVSTDVDGDMSDDDMDDDMSSDVSHDDDFDDIHEAIIDDLEKIKTPNTDGREAGNKMIQQNNKSLPNVRDKSAGPIKSKNVTHKGFDRETAPSSARLPKGINTQDSATARLKSVSKNGDSSAELNKPVKQNNVSPIAKPKKK